MSTASATATTRSSLGEVISQYLTFVLGGEAFAMGILAIKEIIEYTRPTPVPMTPDYVRGVINLRDAAVPVLDLSVRFGRQSSAVTKRTCIVIVEVDVADARYDFGLVVDAVTAVVDIPAGDIQPPPSFGARIRTDCILGMANVNNRFIVLLGVAQILAAEELLVISGDVGGTCRTRER